MVAEHLLDGARLLDVALRRRRAVRVDVVHRRGGARRVLERHPHGALRAGGRSLAVLGCGVRVIYPPSNTALAEHILAHGALVSETHPDASPDSSTLVARNRLISGLCRAVIVVEAGETSGSLHAARFAQVQGRPVYAVANCSPGNQHLIANGARALPPEDKAWMIVLAALADQG